MSYSKRKITNCDIPTQISGKIKNKSKMSQRSQSKVSQTNLKQSDSKNNWLVFFTFLLPFFFSFFLSFYLFFFLFLFIYQCNISPFLPSWQPSFLSTASTAFLQLLHWRLLFGDFIFSISMLLYWSTDLYKIPFSGRNQQPTWIHLYMT